MAHQGSRQAWGKLVKVDASPDSEILLINRECTVGRKKGTLNIMFMLVSQSCYRLFYDCLVLLININSNYLF